VRALKRLMSTRDKRIVGTLEFLKRKECLDFSKWSPWEWGPLPLHPVASAQASRILLHLDIAVVPSGSVEIDLYGSSFSPASPTKTHVGPRKPIAGT
jgi:hypothetical protein